MLALSNIFITFSFKPIWRRRRKKLFKWHGRGTTTTTRKQLFKQHWSIHNPRNILIQFSLIVFLLGNLNCRRHNFLKYKLKQRTASNEERVVWRKMFLPGTRVLNVKCGNWNRHKRHTTSWAFRLPVIRTLRPSKTSQLISNAKNPRSGRHIFLSS